jgi:hypothetical protein
VEVADTIELQDILINLPIQLQKQEQHKPVRRLVHGMVPNRQQVLAGNVIVLARWRITYGQGQLPHYPFGLTL